MMVFKGIISIIIVIAILLTLYSLFKDPNCCQCGSFENDCCPCINESLIPEVKAYYGYGPSSAGSWIDMCDGYAKDHNLTLKCFE